MFSILLRSLEVCGQNASADHFDNLRHDRIAERLELVHPAGNPMSQQTNSGFNPPETSVPAQYPFCGGPMWAA